MATAKVYNMEGAEVGTVDLNDAVFSAEMNPALVHDVIVAMQAARRQGNAETKTRKQVRGGGRKPYRQKGTGNARHGSIREPQMRGGGVVFGPHKRSYRKNVPTSFKRKALCCALSDRLREESLLVLDDLPCAAPKTKPVAEMVQKLPLSNKRTLIVTAQADRNVVLSARNLQRVDVQSAADLNALDVFRAARVVVVQDALKTLEERLS